MVVTDIADRRGPASVAALLYEEERPSRRTSGSGGGTNGGWLARSAPTFPHARRSATGAASTHSGAGSGAANGSRRLPAAGSYLSRRTVGRST